jgi:P-type Ca2+ transporter type 2C
VICPDGVDFAEIGGQILIIVVGGTPFQVTRIGGREWGISLAIGVVPIPLGALIRLIPTAPCEGLFVRSGLLPNMRLLPTTRTDEWNPTIDLVRDKLWVFEMVRGGRVRCSSLINKDGTVNVASRGGSVHLCVLFSSHAIAK